MDQCIVDYSEQRKLGIKDKTSLEQGLCKEHVQAITECQKKGILRELLVCQNYYIQMYYDTYRLIL